MARRQASGERQVQGISPEAMMLLKAYPWPGNVRELENAIEQAILLGEGETISPEDLPEHIRDLDSTDPDAWSLPLKQARHRFERQYLT